MTLEKVGPSNSCIAFTRALCNRWGGSCGKPRTISKIYIADTQSLDPKCLQSSTTHSRK